MDRIKENPVVFTLIVMCFLSAAGVAPSAAKVLITVDQALKKMYKKATDFVPETIVLTEEQAADIGNKAKVRFGTSHAMSVRRFTVQKDGQVIGYAYEDIVIGKWGPIHYLLGLDPDGTILEAIVLDYREIRGRPIAKRRFLRQYKRKTIDDPVMLRRDIDGISGATISSTSITDGIRKLLHIHEQIK